MTRDDAYTRGEATEKELDTLIRRRHEKRRAEEGERPLEDAWAESVRRHDASRKAENVAASCECHRSQAERHKRMLGFLVDFHEREAQRYANTPTKGAA